MDTVFITEIMTIPYAMDQKIVTLSSVTCKCVAIDRQLGVLGGGGHSKPSNFTYKKTFYFNIHSQFFNIKS